jgi:dihydroorotase
MHLAFIDMDVLYYAQMCKILPPLRKKKDREALREGLFDGSIDCISSLHTPLCKKEKELPSSDAPFGASSIETVLPVLLTYMPEILRERPERLPMVLSCAPSEIVNEPFDLKLGEKADFVLVDPTTELVVTENTLRSKSLNSPFLGQTLMSSLRLYLNGYPM